MEKSWSEQGVSPEKVDPTFSHRSPRARQIGGLTGWVQNVGYDTVEAIAEGERDEAESCFKTRLRSVPPRQPRRKLPGSRALSRLTSGTLCWADTRLDINTK